MTWGASLLRLSVELVLVVVNNGVVFFRGEWLANGERYGALIVDEGGQRITLHVCIHVEVEWEV